MRGEVQSRRAGEVLFKSASTPARRAALGELRASSLLLACGGGQRRPLLRRIHSQVSA